MRAATPGPGTDDTLMIEGLGMIPRATRPPPATNAAVALNGDLSMTFNWVAADSGGNPIRSMLVMRANKPVSMAPTLSQANSIAATGNPVTFGAPANVFLGASNYMVFATSDPAASTNVTCTVNRLSQGVVYYATV